MLTSLASLSWRLWEDLCLMPDVGFSLISPWLSNCASWNQKHIWPISTSFCAQSLLLNARLVFALPNSEPNAFWDSYNSFWFKFVLLRRGSITLSPSTLYFPWPAFLAVKTPQLGRAKNLKKMVRLHMTKDAIMVLKVKAAGNRPTQMKKQGMKQKYGVARQLTSVLKTGLRKPILSLRERQHVVCAPSGAWNLKGLSRETIIWKGPCKIYGLSTYLDQSEWMRESYLVWVITKNMYGVKNTYEQQYGRQICSKTGLNLSIYACHRIFFYPCAQYCTFINRFEKKIAAPELQANWYDLRMPELQKLWNPPLSICFFVWRLCE